MPRDRSQGQASIGLKGMNTNHAHTSDHSSRVQEDGIKITVLRQTDNGRGDRESQHDLHEVRLYLFIYNNPFTEDEL